MTGSGSQRQQGLHTGNLIVREQLVQTSNKENIKLCINVPLWRNPPVISGFRLQRASNAASASMSWCHHDMEMITLKPPNDEDL